MARATRYRECILPDGNLWSNEDDRFDFTSYVGASAHVLSDEDKVEDLNWFTKNYTITQPPTGDPRVVLQEHAFSIGDAVDEAAEGAFAETPMLAMVVNVFDSSGGVSSRLVDYEQMVAKVRYSFVKVAKSSKIH